MNGNVTIQEAKEIGREYGFTLRKCPDTGEFLVYPKGNKNENCRYYADDLEDAINTGIDMMTNILHASWGQ